MLALGAKVLALFLGYGAVGWGGDLAAEALGRVLRPDTHRQHLAVGVEVDAPHRWGGEECRFEATRTVALDAGAVQALRVRAGSGELEMEGRAGLGRVEASARACASDQEALDALLLTLERDGADLVLSAHYPERRGRGSWGDGDYARLDLVVHFPLGMALDVDDSSGGMTVSGSGALEIDDSSGSILVSDAGGAVHIRDSSGEVEVSGVRGDVEIEDGSGEIALAGVEGSVRIRDGSGSVEVADVARDVVILGDGSGSISVRDVGGDFRVQADGSGSIHHANVAGAVEIPRDKRRDRGGR